MNEALRLDVPVDLSDSTQPIVVVDDEELDFESIARGHRLSSLANPLRHFLDGQSFLDYLDAVKRGEATMPALVLMDVNMPGMDGFEVTATMRRDARFRDVPVVSMLSSSTDRRDLARADAAGADAYLVKPFDPKVYVEFFSSLAA